MKRNESEPKLGLKKTQSLAPNVRVLPFTALLKLESPGPTARKKHRAGKESIAVQVHL